MNGFRELNIFDRRILFIILFNICFYFSMILFVKSLSPDIGTQK